MAMPANAGQEFMTADELLVLEIPGKTSELIRGRLVVHEPPGSYHGQVAGQLTVLVGSYVRAQRLGRVFGQDTGFRIASDPDTVRAPDFAFLRIDRCAEVRPRGYGAFAPDLVAEIVSPDDSRAELLAKVGQWLDAGVRLVWVIDPERVQAQVYRGDGSVAIVDADGLLEGEDVLPGFSCALGAVLE